MAIIHNNKYKRVARFEADFNGAGFMNVFMEIYDNEEDREKTKQGIEYKVKGWETVSLDNSGFNTDKTKDIRDNIYAKIKEKEEYQNAEDAI